MTVRKFMLKKYPTNKYWDCPISKDIWPIIQEYAEAFHAEKVKQLLTLPNITDAIKKQWVKDFGVSMDDQKDVDGYLLCGLVHAALTTDDLTLKQ